MDEAIEFKLLKLARKKRELLVEILSVAEQQKTFCLENNIDIYREFMDHRNECFEKLKKTDVMLQRYLRQAQLSVVLNEELDAINRNSAETIRRILTVDEVNQINLKQAMEMIKKKKGSLKANKQGVVNYFKSTSYPMTGVHTDSKG